MNKKDKELLLKLSRNTLEAYYKDTDPDTVLCSHLTQLMGCFVTLHKNTELRGCIGFPKPIMPLFEQVIAATKAAAFDDPRFDPLMKEELQDIKIEISVLTDPKIIDVQSQQDYINEIKIGHDGLIIHYLGRSGLLLPQVATEYKYNAEQFLESLCLKAGLPKNTWKTKEAKIYKFQAEIFAE